MLTGKTVVLAVTGSIAAYKIANLARMLKKLHADVQVLMTQNATNFINPITLETLTNQKCLIDTFDRNFQYSVEHVALAKRADVVLVAPASAKPTDRSPRLRARPKLAFIFTVASAPFKAASAPAFNSSFTSSESQLSIATTAGTKASIIVLSPSFAFVCSSTPVRPPRNITFT